MLTDIIVLHYAIETLFFLPCFKMIVLLFIPKVDLIIKEKGHSALNVIMHFLLLSVCMKIKKVFKKSGKAINPCKEVL